MIRKLILLALFAAAIATISAGAATAKARGTNGKIVVSADNQLTGQEQVYTVDPDGSDLKLLLNDAEAGQWSPDGTQIAIGAEDGDHLVNPDNGSYINLPLPALYPDMLLPCGVWAPNGGRLACEGFGGPGNGVYTIRASDGGDLQRVTSGADDDCPGDYSPNGKRLVFIRNFWDTGIEGLFVAKVDGSGLRQVTPPGMNLIFNCGSWSPQGNEILFAARVPDFHYRGTIWVVHSDGGGLRQIPIPGCGGLRSDPTTIGCDNPSWSPDGQKIMFSRHFLTPRDYFDLYTVNPDGSGLSQITDTPNIDEHGGDWGTHPLTP